MSILDAVHSIQAAKDIGDVKGDKGRKAALIEITKGANALSDIFEGAAFPEVAQAILTVKELVNLQSKLDETTIKLKMAPPGSLEAVDAQKNIDKIRSNLDVMIPQLSSSMKTLDKLLKDSVAMEKALKAVQDEVATLSNALAVERIRLASAANAVENAAKLG